MHKISVAHMQEEHLTKRPFTRRDFLSTSLKAGAAAFTTALLTKRQTDAEGHYNVLFIIVDDLRPLLGCYGHPEIHTPNIDALAQRGTLFNRAYCQFPVCNPSRASILTGLRPDTTGVLDNSTDFRQTVPEALTLPQHFKTHGYHVRSVGKIAHGFSAWNDRLSWSVPIWRPRPRPYRNTPSWQALDFADDELPDGEIAKHAIEVLEEIQDSQFFLAVGFKKPHMPFNAPAKFYELYDPQIFQNIPQVAPHSGHEIRVFSDIPSGDAPLSNEKTLELLRAYAASTSFVDAQVGRVLNQLDTLGLTKSTIVLLCGDHGFHLGEHGTWGKRTTYEVALRTPLIVSIPGQEHFGIKTEALVELVDIFPTLSDACQLPIPEQLEGLSMVPIIQQPTSPWKSAAFSRIGGERGKRSIRTERYRYTEHGLEARFGKELYDHNTDPDEQVNIANLPENSLLVSQLSELLQADWQAALPTNQERNFNTVFLPWDVNNDGIVDIQDLILVSSSFGAETLEYPKVDVNQDGSVDIVDLLHVAAHFGESASTTAPQKSAPLPPKHVDRIEEWIVEARLADDGSNVFRQGIVNLEMLMNSVVPRRSALLPNYPNPFNPETWIPYDLAEDADVHVHIYGLKGESVRRLNIGFQSAGTYRTQSRAAYWDGRNSVGESVASGTYLYTLTAQYRNRNLSESHFRATRRMVIVK